MRNLPLVAAFVALAFVGWGVFGPLLELGQISMHYSALRPLICVGVATFLSAVGGSIVLLRAYDEEGHWTSGGIAWGLIAGAAAAIGTLGVMLAMKYRGDAVTVLPAAVGLIPVMHALWRMFVAGTLKENHPLFYGAAVFVMVGAVGVVLFQPRPQNVAIEQTETGKITVTRITHGGDQETTMSAASFEELKSKPHLEEAYRLYQQTRKLGARETGMVALGVLLAALCWGSYPTALRKSRRAMEGSRLRPLLVVGVAFLALGVVGPIVLLLTSPEAGRWTFMGVVWALLAGIAAIGGSLGLIGALNCGGRTGYVLPIVFAGTLVVTTAVGLLLDGTIDDASTLFYISLVLILIGAAAAPIFAALDEDDEDESAGQSSNRRNSDDERSGSRQQPAASD